MPQYDDTASRLARLEAQHQSIAQSLNRHDEWVREHEVWTTDQRDRVYRTIADAERRVVERMEESDREFRESILALKTRIFAWQVVGSILAAVVTSLAAIATIYAALAK